MNANAYCWVLCQKIAEELSKTGYISKKMCTEKQSKTVATCICSSPRKDAVERYNNMAARHEVDQPKDAGECKSLKVITM